MYFEIKSNKQKLVKIISAIKQNSLFPDVTILPSEDETKKGKIKLVLKF